MADPRQAKVDQINFRAPHDYSPRIKIAAALVGVSASEFMRRAIARSLADALKNSGPAPQSNEQR